MKTFFLKFTTTLLVLLYSLVFQANADELFNKGKEVFLEAGNCAACHTLSDAGSIADIGPNLNQIRPQVQTILMQLRMELG